MQTMEIHDQPVLSLGRTARLTANGIRYRLFRAAITVVVVAVAIAFQTNILSESVIKRAVAQETREGIAVMRLAAAWEGRLSAPGSVEEILRVASEAPGDGPALRELAAMGGLGEQETAAFVEGAREACALLGFLSDLDYARRRALAGASLDTAALAAVFDRLQDAERMEHFVAALGEMKTLRLPLSPEAFRGFIGRWPEIEGQAGRIREGQTAAIAKVRSALQGASLNLGLTRADGEFGDAIRAAGFLLDEGAGRQVAQQARRMREKLFLEQSIRNADLRKGVAARLEITPAEVTATAFWRFLRSDSAAAWYVGALKAAAREGRVAGFALADYPGLDAARLAALASVERDERLLARAERVQAGDTGGILGIGERMSWLLLVSVLVCVAGITNAMLMSVAERFREIATLKCLGALDRFILLMFVLEACVLGLAGGILGALLGTLIGAGRMLLTFGSLVRQAFPAGDLAAAIGLAVLLGVVLAAVSAVYPSIKAARLAPMEAMRIE